MNCLLCHSATRSYFNYGRYTGQSYSLIRCAACGLVQTEPIPSEDFLRGWYQKYDVLGEREPYYQALAQDDPWLTPEGLEIAKRFVFVKRSAPSPFPSPSRGEGRVRVDKLRVLDVGSGHGLFLDLVKRAGWQGIGIEINHRAAEISRERFAIDVRTGTIESVPFEPASFDVITLWDIFEHLRDPLGLLTRAYELLKPGGLLFIETPRVDALLDLVVIFLARIGITGPAQTFYGPHHLTLWTPKNLKKALEERGFKLLETRSAVTSADRVFRGRSLRDRLMRIGVGLIQSIGNWIGRPNKMIIIAQKQ